MTIPEVGKETPVVGDGGMGASREPERQRKALNEEAVHKAGVGSVLTHRVSAWLGRRCQKAMS